MLACSKQLTCLCIHGNKLQLTLLAKQTHVWLLKKIQKKKTKQKAKEKKILVSKTALPRGGGEYIKRFHMENSCWG